MEKLVFVFYQYALLGVFAVDVYGLSKPRTGWMKDSFRLSPFVTLPLKLASGIGIAMISLFVAGILDHLSSTVISILILMGFGLAGFSIVRCPPMIGNNGSIVKRVLRVGANIWW
ncbi:MAG: hypothetical protein SV775_08000 [Thermodesulfobacteriota bacterium]|nr:hypothetical protein [Thermodesulfobacteriota bacterium]